MLTFVDGELSNSATYFYSFANVRIDETNNFDKTYGTRKTNQWKPWDYQKRVADAKKVEAFKSTIKNQVLLLPAEIK